MLCEVGESQVPNIIMYSGAIGACGTNGEWQIALQLLHDMQHEDHLQGDWTNSHVEKVYPLCASGISHVKKEIF